MAINLCYISFIFDDNLLRRSPIPCTKTLMHLKSDFKPNILWENIVLIIHLKISWRWFITCCKKKISWGSYKWVGQSERLFIKTRLSGQLLLFPSSISEFFQHWLLLHTAVSQAEPPSTTFVIVTQAVGFQGAVFPAAILYWRSVCRKRGLWDLRALTRLLGGGGARLNFSLIAVRKHTTKGLQEGRAGVSLTVWGCTPSGHGGESSSCRGGRRVG